MMIYEVDVKAQLAILKQLCELHESDECEKRYVMNVMCVHVNRIKIFSCEIFCKRLFKIKSKQGESGQTMCRIKKSTN